MVFINLQHMHRRGEFQTGPACYERHSSLCKKQLLPSALFKRYCYNKSRMGSIQ